MSVMVTNKRIEEILADDTGKYDPELMALAAEVKRDRKFIKEELKKCRG